MSNDKKSADYHVKNLFSKLGISKNGFLVILTIFMIIVIIKILLSTNFYAPFIVPDEYIYDNNAFLLSTGHFYPSMGTVPPLYQIILSLSYHVSNDQNVVYHVMLGISCVMSSLTIFPAYFILKRYIEPIYAIPGAIAITIIPALNFFTFTLMLENLFIPLLLFALWAIIEAFDTHTLRWQILAGTSIACLEITRSLGQVIEFSFLLTFVVYLLLNRNSGILRLLKNNMAMLLSFVTVFSVWHVFLQLMSKIAVSGVGGSSGNVGTSYKALSIFSSIGYIFQNYYDFILSVKVLINHFDYLFLSLYLIPVFLIYYFFINRDNKILLNTGYQFCGILIFLSILLMVFSVTIFNMSLIESLTEFHFSLGRYLDPLLPPIIIFGLISICKANINHFKIHFVNYFIFMECAVLVIVYISTYSHNIIYEPKDCINNPSLIYLYLIDYWIYPLVILALSILSTVILFLASINKRIILVLLLLIICLSLICSYVSYNYFMNSSEVLVNNNISHYLYENSNDQTMVLIDKNLTGWDNKFARYIDNFWNDGETSLIDINESNLSALMASDNVYLVTTSNFNYTPVAVDDRLKLYHYDDV